MSISVTVSGEDSTSVVLSQALSDTVSVSGTSSVQVTTTSGNSATVTVSTGDPVTITGNYSNYVTGEVVRPSEISNFITSSDLSSLETATGDLNTRVNKNESDILTVSGLIISNDGDISALQTATGLLVQKSETGNFVTDSDTGAFYSTSNPSGFITGVDLSDLQAATGNLNTRVIANESGITTVSGLIASNDSDISALQTATGLLVQKSETGNFVTDSDTGAFYGASNPSGFITGVDLSDLEAATGVLSSATGVLKSDIVSNDNDISALQTATGLLVQKSETGNFITDSDTGAFYATSNPSGFITGVDLSSYVQNSETGLFLVSGEDAVVNTLGVGDAPDANIDLHVKSTSAKFLVENTSPGGEWVRFSAGTVGTAMKFANTASFSIGPVASKTDQNVVNDFYMSSAGDIGVGTSSPSEKLHVSGNTYIDGVLKIVDSTLGGVKSITAANNNLTFSSVHGIFGYSIGLRGSRGSTLGMESAGSILDISAPSDITLTPGGDTEIQSNLIVYGNTITTGDLTVSGNSFFQNRPTVNGTGVLLSGEGGGGAVENVVYTTGNQNISGVKNFISRLEVSSNTTDDTILITTTEDSSDAAPVVTLKRNSSSTSNGDYLGQIKFKGENDADQEIVYAKITAKISDDTDTTEDGLIEYAVKSDGSNLIVSRQTPSSLKLINGVGLEVDGATILSDTLRVDQNTTLNSGLSVDGPTTVGKISLSENSFVTETGNFTLGSTHRGATVLLQNSAPMTVTIPAQVSGHTTTFIAETSNSVVFTTGAGISGFNSFNSANQIAGIYGQAQIIFKSPEYAFLGGNVV